MARIRTIKPEAFTDPDLATRSFGARWLFVGLWTEADDKGRLIDSPKKIAGAIFPHEEKVTAAKVRGWLDELEEIGSVMRYEADGLQLLWLPKFLKHQVISHPSKSRLPAHPADSGVSPEDDPTPSGRSRKSSRPEVEVEVDLGSGSGIHPRNGKRPAGVPTNIDQRVAASIEEEDEFFVEAKRQMGVWAKSHEIINPTSVLRKFLTTLHIQHPDGLAPAIPLRVLPEFVPADDVRASADVAEEALVAARGALVSGRRSRGRAS